jgi:hypothetical protein
VIFLRGTVGFEVFPTTRGLSMICDSKAAKVIAHARKGSAQRLLCATLVCTIHSGVGDGCCAALGFVRIVVLLDSWGLCRCGCGCVRSFGAGGGGGGEGHPVRFACPRAIMSHKPWTGQPSQQFSVATPPPPTPRDGMDHGRVGIGWRTLFSEPNLSKWVANVNTNVTPNPETRDLDPGMHGCDGTNRDGCIGCIGWVEMHSVMQERWIGPTGAVWLCCDVLGKASLFIRLLESLDRLICFVYRCCSGVVGSQWSS